MSDDDQMSEEDRNDRQRIVQIMPAEPGTKYFSVNGYAPKFEPERITRPVFGWALTQLGYGVFPLFPDDEVLDIEHFGRQDGEVVIGVSLPGQTPTEEEWKEAEDQWRLNRSERKRRERDHDRQLSLVPDV